jgi:hypothetical protein
MFARLRHFASVAAVTYLIPAATLAPSALAAGTPPASAPALAAQTQSKAGTAVLVTTRTVIPKIQRTSGFTGYATYSFSAPRGRRIVSASARIAGGDAHAVAIRSRVISHKRTRYTISLIFPGEQGSPGKLIVRLGTIR